MSLKSPRELAACMALAACQINTLQPLAADLPTLGWDAQLHGQDAFVLEAHVFSCYYDDHGTFVSLDAEAEIDALRTWAHALGSDLHLAKVSRNGDFEILRLETSAELDNGLKLRITAAPYYQTGQPAPEAAALSS